MTDIKPWVHIGVGLLVGGVSIGLKMVIFVPVAAGFVIWGFYRLAKGKKGAPQVHAPVCPFCHYHVKPHDNFCSNCGAYLKYNRSNPNFHHSGHNQYPNRQHHQVRRIN
jgi:hypothetical protein